SHAIADNSIIRLRSEVSIEIAVMHSNAEQPTLTRRNSLFNSSEFPGGAVFIELDYPSAVAFTNHRRFIDQHYRPRSVKVFSYDLRFTEISRLNGCLCL